MIKNLSLKIKDFLLVHIIQLSILSIVIGLLNLNQVEPFIVSGLFVGINFVLLSASVFLITEIQKLGGPARFLLAAAAIFKYVFLGVGGYFVITQYRENILFVLFGFSTILVTIFATSVIRVANKYSEREKSSLQKRDKVYASF